MDAESRIAALRLMDKLEKNPEYAKRLGVAVTVRKTETTILEKKENDYDNDDSREYQ